MRKSGFRLASVLSLREAQRDTAARETARLEAHLRGLAESHARITREREVISARALVIGETTAANLHLAAEYLGVLDREEKQIRRDVERAGEMLSHSRSTLIEYHGAVGALERLRDRQAAEARREETRQERVTLDEVAGLRAERKRHQ